jgi:eukaryotic-like serine/threonine-protein kinase
MTPERYKRMREIFGSAVELPSGAEEFVRAECGGDEEMYQEVIAMLRAHERTAFVDSPPAANGAAPARALSDRVFAEEQIVAGRYRIVRYLSCGGMGEVYEAEDLHLPEMKEHVALKTLLPAIAADQTMVARFRQEIALSRKVQHPNVCGAFDISRHETEGPNPVLFLTMPFLAGETLAAKLHDGGRMQPSEALPLMQQMADALDAAHRAGVIHRDFKPSNVMLVPAAEGVRAVVTDFGLARRLVTGDDTTSTVTMHAAGTLDYMAPELLTGSMASVSSDVYALGMTAYRMVTGALPFASETPLAGAILRAKRAVPAPRTSAPDLDPKWDSAIQRALDAKPGNRFSSAGEFVSALCGDTASFVVPLPSFTWTRAITAGLAVALAAGAAVGWRLWERERNRPSAEAEALYKTGVDDIHAGAYFAATKALRRAVQIAPRYALAHARLADAWLELDTQNKAQEEMLRAKREDNIEESQLDRFQIAAVDLTITREFDAAVGKYEQILRLAGTNNAGALADLGRAYLKAGKPDKAIEFYRRATEGAGHNPAAWLWLGVLYSRRSDSGKSTEAFDEADQLYRLTSNLEGLIEVAYQRGAAAYRNGQLEESAAYYGKALETARLAGNPHQEIRAKLQLSMNAYLAGDSDAAERLAREAIESAHDNQMESAAISGIVNLGNVCFDKRDFAGAEKNYQDALTLAKRDESPRLTAASLLSLASLHDQMGHYDDVSREAQQALVYYQANRFTEQTMKALALLGRADYHRGRNSAALESFRHLLDVAEKAQNRPLMALGHESIGLVYFRQERYPEALEEYQRDLEFSTDAFTTGYAHLQCGDVLWLLGRYDEARAMFDQAETSAAKFPQLQISLIRARAKMALSRNQYQEALAFVRRALAAGGSQNPTAVAELKEILGLALLSSGKEQEGRRSCEEALSTVAAIGDNVALLGASLAVIRSRMEARDRAGALALFHRIEATLNDLPESRWRALALISRADSQYLGRARQYLEELSGRWGKEAVQAYLSRPDIAELSRPLIQSIHANR